MGRPMGSICSLSLGAAIPDAFGKAQPEDRLLGVVLSGSEPAKQQIAIEDPALPIDIEPLLRRVPLVVYRSRF
jgi:hypothetical protein